MADDRGSKDARPRSNPLHQIEIDVRHQLGQRQHRIEQLAMLRGYDNPHIEPPGFAQGGDNREHLDRFRPGAEGDENAGFPACFAHLRNIPRVSRPAEPASRR